MAARGGVGGVLGRAVVAGLRSALRSTRSARSGRPARTSRASRWAGSAGSARPTGRRGAGYPGDFTGTATLEYTPSPDGEADPGEVVWAWVPYEEDHTQGKDRPALVIGRDHGWLLALMLTSRDHDGRGGADGQRWMDVGTGAWDSQRRPSEVRLDRVLRLAPGDVRREGAALGRDRFEQVAEEVRALHGWR